MSSLPQTPFPSSDSLHFIPTPVLPLSRIPKVLSKCPPHPTFCNLPSPTSRPARMPKGFWTNLDNLKEELCRLQPEIPTLSPDTLPSSRDLRSLGRRDLDNAISKLGGYPMVALQLGWSTSSGRRPPHYWDRFENVEREMKLLLKKHKSEIREGCMPTQKQLREWKCAYILKGIDKHGGAFKVAERLGFDITRPKKKGYWKDWVLVEEEVRAFVEKRREAGGGRITCSKSDVERMPSQRELRSAGRADLAEAISDFHGGFRKVAKRLGYISRKKDDFFYNFFYNLAKEIYSMNKQMGRESFMPSTATLKGEGRSDLAVAIVKFGGMSKVSQRLGLKYQVRTREALKDWDIFRKNMLAFMKTHGTSDEIPSSRTLENFGRTDLYIAILHHGGSQEVADKMGIKRTYWQDFYNVGMELLSFIDIHGTEGVMPTEGEFLEIGRSSLNLAIGKFGYSQVALRLGLSVPPQSTQVALDAFLNQSMSLSDYCDEGDESEESDFKYC